MHRIMLVDDEPNVLKALQRILSAPDRDLETYTDPLEALRRAEVAPFDLFLVDYRMPVLDGIGLLTRIKRVQPEAVRMVISGYADLEGLIAAVNDGGIERFVTKPWQDYDLKVAVQKALEHRDLRVENRRLADQVRLQRDELARLEVEHPGITRVEWAADGSIRLDDEGL